jgi:hypothetical protein
VGFPLTPATQVDGLRSGQDGAQFVLRGDYPRRFDYTQLSATVVVVEGRCWPPDSCGLARNGSTIVQSGVGISGIFKNLPQGSTVNVSGQNFTISYLGGKVTLTAT